MSRPTIAILSEKNLLHNIQTIKKTIRNKRIMAMIKSNGYGHGIRSIASRISNHVDYFGVASIEEALIIRSRGITTPIALMEGVFEKEELFLATQHDLQVICHHETQLDWLDSVTLASPIKIWLKVDTGMGRLGFFSNQIQAISQRLAKNKNVISPINLMSHFANANDKNHVLNQTQIMRFNQIAKNFSGIKSLSNSVGVFDFPEIDEDLVRVGIALYGVSPILNQSAKALGLLPVLTLQSQLISIKNFLKGDSIGYLSEFICPKNMSVGIVAIGYGDGYPITAPTGTPVLINGKLCSLIGKISMDMLAVDLSNCVNAKLGDSVTLWGDGLPVETIAEYAKQNSYSLLTGIQYRVKFIWDTIDA